jgi:hypothetical protein
MSGYFRSVHVMLGEFNLCQVRSGFIRLGQVMPECQVRRVTSRLGKFRPGYSRLYQVTSG